MQLQYTPVAVSVTWCPIWVAPDDGLPPMALGGSFPLTIVSGVPEDEEKIPGSKRYTMTMHPMTSNAIEMITAFFGPNLKVDRIPFFDRKFVAIQYDTLVDLRYAVFRSRIGN